MKIKSVHIKNLRSVKDQVVTFNDYSCLVGSNGSGKSTILCALNIFFRETSHSSIDLTTLCDEDFHHKNTADPIEITVTFTDLSDEAKQDLRHYVRHDELVVTARAEYDPNTKRAEVRQYGQRMVIQAFVPYFRAEGENALAKVLTSIYTDIRAEFPDLPAPGTKQAMADALRTYEEAHPDLCSLVPSQAQFYGISKGANLIEKHIQWVFVPAVKDAVTEDVELKNTALAKLLARTVRNQVSFEEKIKELQQRVEEEYGDILAEHQGHLNQLSTSLQGRLANWSHADTSVKLEWRSDPGKSVRVEQPFAQIIAGEGIFEGRLARFGHGLQRCYLLALLQELASGDDTGGPTLVLALEEPELFQHPPQAQHLADVLRRLTEHHSQVMVCTHSPYFVAGDFFEDVRLVRKHRTDHCSEVRSVTYQALSATIAAASGAPPTRPEGVAARIHQALQPSLNEMFFSPILVLVEGLEDVAYITAYLHLRDLWSEWRRLGCHLVPANGKSRLIEPRAIAALLCIPTFLVFDTDAHAPDRNGSRSKHERDNRVLFALAGATGADPLPTTTHWGTSVVAWASTIGLTVEDEIGHDDWREYEDRARAINGFVPDLEKNSLFIADVLAMAWADGKVSSSLTRLCDTILAFARNDGGHLPIHVVADEEHLVV